MISIRSSSAQISPLLPRRLSSTIVRIRKSSHTSFPVLMKSFVTAPCSRKSMTCPSSGLRACASVSNNGRSSVLSTSSWLASPLSAPCLSPFPSPWPSNSVTAVPSSTARSASAALARNIRFINSVLCASMLKNTPVPSWPPKTTRALPKSANSSAPPGSTNYRRSSTSSTAT